MADDIFLVLPKDKNLQIAGDSEKDPYASKAFPGGGVLVPVRGFSFGTEHSMQIGSMTGGAGAGKAEFKPLVVEKAVDGLSPSLFTMCAQGGHFATMQLALRRAGGARDGKPYLVYEFQTVFISDLQWTEDDGDGEPREQITFLYGALAIGYSSQKADGSPGVVTKQSWSQVLNKPAPETLATF
jgi:type VI secretion system secreted protein Hcp